MSKDTATLDQALGTVAKFTRVMRKAGLPDEFYQRVINNRDLREALVHFADGTYTTARRLFAPAFQRFKEIEDKLGALGITRQDSGPADNMRTLDIDGRAHNVCFNRSYSVKAGPATLAWGLSVEEGNEDSVMLSLHMGEVFWTICLDTPVGSNATRADINADGMCCFTGAPPEDRPMTLSDWPPAERWFIMHCAFMNPVVAKDLSRFWSDSDKTELDTGRSRSWWEHQDTQIRIMVKTFKTCVGYKEPAQDQIVCPRCCGTTELLGKRLYNRAPGHDVELPEYACTAGCTMEIHHYGQEGTVHERLEFVIVTNGLAFRIPLDHAEEFVHY